MSETKFVDFKKLREERKYSNYTNVQKIISSLNKPKDIHNNKNINQKQLTGLLDYLGINLETLVQKCKDETLIIKLTSMIIAKNSSRQGSLDESMLFKLINDNCNLKIQKLPNSGKKSYSPLRKGTIVSGEYISKNKINKSDLLKSMDGKLTGDRNGWVFAKISYGNGGHQDNCFNEAQEFADWVLDYGDKNLDYIILFETDDIVKINNLKKKYQEVENLLICDHYELISIDSDNK